MGADGSGGNTPSAPRQLNSVADIQNMDDAVGRIYENAENAHPSLFTPASQVDAGIESTMRKEVAAYAQNQYQQLLAADLETQAAPSFAGHNYSSYTATQIKQMVTTNMDPTTAGEASSGWNGIGNSYVTVAQGLGQAAANSEYGWQGAAGDSARGFINGIAKWAGTAGQGAQLAGNRLGVQSEAAATAKNSVPTNPVEPPTAQDIAANMLQGGANPVFGAIKLNAQFQQAAADHAEAVAAAQVYDGSLASSGEKFPAFDAPPTFDSGTGTGASLPSGGGSGGHVLGANVRVGRLGTGGGRGGTSQGGCVPGGGVSRPAVTAPSGAGAGAGAGAGTGAGAATGTGSGAGTGAGSGSGTGVPSLATGQAGFEPGGGTRRPGAGSSGVSVPSQGNFGGGSGDRSFSGSLVGELGPGVGSVGGGLRGGAGLGGRSGVGAGAVGEEEVESSAGVRGGGAGGSGMMPARGGKRGEDSEHKRADYLLNPDPDATFGPDAGFVVPPVIGE
ncbi:MAG TPA: hypothetical protein VJ914_29995 [Pseudonocardiaceae bacterium]|nr:hypothetical protein [Pseudonocardiaceae bacterium]